MLADQESTLDDEVELQGKLEYEGTNSAEEDIPEAEVKAMPISDTLAAIQAELENILGEKNLPIVWNPQKTDGEDSEEEHSAMSGTGMDYDGMLESDTPTTHR